ncbi:dimethylarginine dimethylaminohydrolase family protein [Enhygromyxa salina]|nr:arginine deiminase family protein [Enhygromyxa salina]
MHTFRHAILRAPAPHFAGGITTVAWTEPPSHARLLAQHQAYAQGLRAAGLSVEILPALDGFPDAYFVEDVAVVLPELAVVTRPGAEARRGETEHIVAALAAHRELVQLEAPATLDGGDVMVLGRRVFVGLSARTNAAGVAALQGVLERVGYTVCAIPVAAGLHFKSSVNLVGHDTLVATAAFAGRPEFHGLEVIEVSDAEAYAANILRVNDHVLVAAGFPELAGKLRARGFGLIVLNMSEVEKMDGGLSCLSLRF